jgi:hypothetical protein
MDAGSAQAMSGTGSSITSEAQVAQPRKTSKYEALMSIKRQKQEELRSINHQITALLAAQTPIPPPAPTRTGARSTSSDPTVSALIDLAHAENESQSLRQAIPLVWGMELSMVAVTEFANSFAARMHLWKEYASGDNTELPIALPTTVQEQLTKLAGLRSNVPVRVLNKATVFLVHRFDSLLATVGANEECTRLMLLNAMIFRSWFNSERHFSEAVRRYQAYGGHTVCGVFALDFNAILWLQAASKVKTNCGTFRLQKFDFISHQPSRVCVP